MAESSRDFWRIQFEFLPYSYGNSISMTDDEVKDLLCRVMRLIKKFFANTKTWHASKRNGYDSIPATLTQSKLDNVLKCSACYDSFGKLDSDRSGYSFLLFTLDEHDQRLGVQLQLGGNQKSKQHGSLAFRVGTSWETLFLTSDYSQFFAKLIEKFDIYSIKLDSSSTGNHDVGHVNYFSKFGYHDFFPFIKKHFKILAETEQGIVVELCKINKKNRTLDLLKLPHVKKFNDMLVEQFREKVRASYS